MALALWQRLALCVPLRCAIGGAVPAEQCPAGSQTFTLPPRSSAQEGVAGDVNRVVMADFPSTGSTWLLKLVTAVTTDGGACASPSCSVYGQEKIGGHANAYNCLVDKPGVYCPCGNRWTPSQGALVFKTHFPVGPLMKQQSFEGPAYEASSQYVKMLLLVRHPIPTIKSNMQRWGGKASALSENLRCWGKWWERGREAVGDTNVHLMRYEDLCLNTAQVLHDFLQFLGGCYKEISLESVQSTLSRSKSLECYYTHTLGKMSASVSFLDRQIIQKVEDLMPLWGYSVEANEWATLLNVSGQSDNISRIRHLREADERGALNPWS